MFVVWLDAQSPLFTTLPSPRNVLDISFAAVPLVWQDKLDALLATAIYEKAKAEVKLAIFQSLKGVIDYACKKPDHALGLYPEHMVGVQHSVVQTCTIDPLFVCLRLLAASP